MPQRPLGYLLLAMAMATVGTTVIASKLIAGQIPPLIATALRLALALPVLGAMALWRGGPLPRLGLRIWGLLVIQAGAGSIGYTVLLILGLAHLPAADAGVVVGTLPAVSAVFAILVLGERPSPRVALAVACATLGVMAVALRPGQGEAAPGADALTGILLILGAVSCESVFILLQKRLGTPLPPLWQSTAMTGLGLALCAPVALAVAPVLPLSAGLWESLGSPAALAVLWYALVPTVAGFLLWYAGAARVPGAEAAVFTAIAPVTAVALSALVLHEAIGPAQLTGLGAVACAILILSRPAARSLRQ